MASCILPTGLLVQGSVVCTTVIGRGPRFSADHVATSSYLNRTRKVSETCSDHQRIEHHLLSANIIHGSGSAIWSESVRCVVSGRARVKHSVSSSKCSTEFRYTSHLFGTQYLSTPHKNVVPFRRKCGLLQEKFSREYRCRSVGGGDGEPYEEDLVEDRRPYSSSSRHQDAGNDSMDRDKSWSRMQSAQVLTGGVLLQGNDSSHERATHGQTPQLPPVLRILWQVALVCCAAFCVSVFLKGRPSLMGNVTTMRLAEQAKKAAIASWPKILLFSTVLKKHGVILCALLGVSAFFSLAETSITTLWPWKVRELAERENEGELYRPLRNDVSRYLTTILVGTTVVNIAATAIVTDAATEMFGEAGVGIATAVMTVLLLIFTEITPKNVAVHNADKVISWIVRPVFWLSVIIDPFGRVCKGISAQLLSLFGFKSSGEPFVSEEELKQMVRGAELSGSIEETEGEMIENVFNIDKKPVREIMTPLVNAVLISAQATLKEFKDVWSEHQFSRVPVYEGRVDNVVGVAYAMDLLDYLDDPKYYRTLRVEKIMHNPALFIPEMCNVANLLREFRIRKVHMAVVLNEYGGTVGEEIRNKTGYIQRRGEGVYDVDTSTSVDFFEEQLELNLSSEQDSYHFDTVSGFVCQIFGHIPRTGEAMDVMLKVREDDEKRREEEDGQHHHHAEHSNWRANQFVRYKVEILTGTHRRVQSVRFTRLPDLLDRSKEDRERERERDKEEEWQRERQRVEAMEKEEEKRSSYRLRELSAGGGGVEDHDDDDAHGYAPRSPWRGPHNPCQVVDEDYRHHQHQHHESSGSASAGGHQGEEPHMHGRVSAAAAPAGMEARYVDELGERAGESGASEHSLGGGNGHGQASSRGQQRPPDASYLDEDGVDGYDWSLLDEAEEQDVGKGDLELLMLQDEAELAAVAAAEDSAQLQQWDEKGKEIEIKRLRRRRERAEAVAELRRQHMQMLNRREAEVEKDVREVDRREAR
eukprot:jgi/Mesen1/5751/ME000292S04827